eukprot:12060534-Alexandrium_andersonii.AAC.1
MSASLVGSEMCIRDSVKGALSQGGFVAFQGRKTDVDALSATGAITCNLCLLYTSEAADDM